MMVRASCSETGNETLKQSGLVTDRAYNQLTINDYTLTRNALEFLWLLLQRSSSSYNVLIEAAQALDL